MINWGPSPLIVFYYSQNSGEHFTYYYRFILKDIIKDIKEQPLGFPGGSYGKETACSAGDLGSISGSGRSPGEGNGNPLQYSCLERISQTEEPGCLQSMGLQSQT